MKKLSLSLFSIPATLIVLVTMLWGCNPSTAFNALKADKMDLVAESSGDTLKVLISSNEAWTAKASQDWLQPNVAKGVANGQVRMTVKVDPNFGDTERKGTVEIKSETQSMTLSVTQKFGNVDISSQQYDLKVIFHVLYNAETEQRLQSQNNPNDEVPDYYPINSAQLQTILDKVNDIYKGWPEEPSTWYRDDRYYANGPRPFPNLNLKFSLATVDPEGNQLTPAGIKKYEITEKELSIEAVMSDGSEGKYHKMGFPIDRYINVYIFPFKPEGNPNSMTLGVAHLPHATTAHPIPGLGTLDSKVSKISNYNHCVVINSKIFEPKQQQSLAQGKDAPYKTIAHELGHVVGLMHVFGEELKDKSLVQANSCIDSDHVDDTFSYNRIKYETDFRTTLAANNNTINLNNSEQMRTLRGRYDCEKAQTYLSTNVMDYDWTYGDRFTNGQYTRVRDVLYYSYSIPGFKIEKTATRSQNSAYAEPRIAKCTTRLIRPLRTGKKFTQTKEDFLYGPKR